MKRTSSLISLCFLSAAFFSNTVYAYGVDNMTEGSWYLSGGVGSDYPRVDDNTLVNTGPGWPSDLYMKQSSHNGPILAIGAGYLFNTYETILPSVSFGLDFTYGFSEKISGTINQYSLAQFHNYTFNYDVRRITLLGMVKINVFRVADLMPFVRLGGGISWNKSSNYQENAFVPVTPRLSPGFSQGTNTAFAYVVGGGFDYAFTECFRASLEYDYGSFGNVKSGDGANISTLTGYNYGDQELSSKLHENTLLLSMTYLINLV